MTGATAGDPSRRSFRGPAVKFLHTGDWHVGKTMRGRSRADEHRAVLDEIAALAAAEQVDAVLVAGDLFDTAAPTAESEQIVYGALLALARSGAHVVVVSGNHDNERRLQAVAPLLELGRVTMAASFRRPDEGGVVEVSSRDGRRAGRRGPAAVPVATMGGPGRRADGDRRRPAGAGVRRAAASSRRRPHGRPAAGPRQRAGGPSLRARRAARRRRAGGAHDLRLRRLGHRLPAQPAVRGPRPPAPQSDHPRAVPHPLCRLAAPTRLRRDGGREERAAGRGASRTPGRGGGAGAAQRPPPADPGRPPRRRAGAGGDDR